MNVFASGLTQDANGIHYIKENGTVTKAADGKYYLAPAAATAIRNAELQKNFKRNKIS